MMDNTDGFKLEDGGPFKERVFRYRDWYMELPEPLPIIMNYIFMATLKKNAQIELNDRNLNFSDYTMYAADYPDKAAVLEYATMNELISEKQYYKNSPLKKLEVSNEFNKNKVSVVIDHPFLEKHHL